MYYSVVLKPSGYNHGEKWRKRRQESKRNRETDKDFFCFPQVTVHLDVFMYNLQQTCESLNHEKNIILKNWKEVGSESK